MKENQLYPEDQARVDQYLREGYNDVEREPFKSWRMMLMLSVAVTLLSVLSVVIARVAGVY